MWSTYDYVNPWMVLMSVGAAHVGDRSCIRCSDRCSDVITVSRTDIMRGGMAKRHSITVWLYKMSLCVTRWINITLLLCVLYIVSCTVVVYEMSAI